MDYKNNISSDIKQKLQIAHQTWQQGDRERAFHILDQILLSNPDLVDVTLTKIRWLLEADRKSDVLRETIGLWRKTKSIEVGDVLADLSEAIITEYDDIQKQDSGVVSRLAKLVQLLCPDGLIIDTLQYGIIGGLAIDAWRLPHIQQAGLLDRIKEKVVYFSGNSANQAIVNMIAREVPLFCDTSIQNLSGFLKYDWDKGRYALNKSFGQQFWGRHEYLFENWLTLTHSTNGSDYIETEEEQKLVKSQTQKISFTQKEHAIGKDFLKKQLGMNDDDWFVCLFARDGAYYGETPQSRNWIRNSDIRSYELGVEEILNQGGYVIRIGEKTNTSMNLQHPHLLDYTTSGLRSDFLDIYLLCNCRFLLGAPSGLCHVAYIFKIPQLMVNCINVLNLASADMYIPKKIVDTAGRTISFNAFLEKLYATPDIGRYWENGINQENDFGIRYQDNSPEEIRDVVVEFLARLNGDYTPDQSLERYHKALKYMWKCHREDMAKVPIGEAFLKQNLHLFPQGE